MKSLIKLADNPLDDSQEEIQMASKSQVTKGRRVSGPRMKLSADQRFDRLERSVFSLAKSVQSLAKGMYSADDELMDEDPMAIEEDPMAYDEEEDPMAVDDIDGEDEDELELGDGEDFLSEFDPYGGEEDHGEPEDEATDQELPTNKARVNRARINRGRISKDDAASSFGEKDEDIPGNRQLDPDHKDKDAGEYLIQGGPSDGQAVQKALRKAVRAELISAGLIRKADGPRVGANTKLEKSAPAPTQAELFEKMKGRSFREINQLRVELGDLPAGII